MWEPRGVSGGTLGGSKEGLEAEQVWWGAPMRSPEKLMGSKWGFGRCRGVSSAL